MRVYYNEYEPSAAAWLRELMKDALIPEGVVDERSIVDVQPGDLAGFDQCHFFAGIGGWPLALQLANWNPARPVWTGSCPCQPFSSAGKHKGTADERHLWPEFFRLIRECRPATIFGEQVASKAGRDWLAGVRADLEGVAYAVGAADLCAAGVGAPHIRQRLYWVADSGGERHHGEPVRLQPGGPHEEGTEAAGCGDGGGVADANEGQRGRVADGEGRQLNGQAAGRQQGNGVVEPSGESGGLADAECHRAGSNPGDNNRAQEAVVGADRGTPRSGSDAGERSAHGFWSRAEWLACADGKARRVEPGIFPLAYGVPGRVGLLRGAGNAIVPQVAATFIEAYLNT